ncbi:dihydroxyacetone kinase subunit DhaK [Nesterenkonia marinintestina]|uniref:dihydroxyacetone kinase subunit DhaK n=1 Tax=Nesterenkonia marinintestina TaxID=2979865 RepID=UPI0021BF82DE|nr:dihydroxyacetone kinase subunit DhaK [Nesterenkonia sp. GX14115]
MAFFNSRETLVDDMLSALLQTTRLEQLATSEGTSVLVRAGHSREDGQVAVISGGGSGHEPAHAGFIGSGMLTAAVPGALFSSPPVSAVLEAIRSVTGPAGCLLVIKNYTGDRLNFGLAAEQARQEGLDVETVLVADDVALPDIDQPRGLAGTVLVHKAAGHLAASGASLSEVAELARRTAESLSTLGLALRPARLPGDEGDPSRGSELGLGIHNEPGADSVEVTGAADAVATVLDGLRPDDVDAGSGLVVLLNDLGGCSPQEGLVLAHEVMRQIGPQRIVRFIGPVRAMTSLDMHGFSVTLAPADARLVEALDAATDAPGWTAAVEPMPPRRRSGDAERAWTSSEADSEAGSGAPMRASEDGRPEAATAQACRVLGEAQEHLDALDRATGDADAGTTFRAGAMSVSTLLEDGHLGFADPAAGMARIARTLETGMGGSSGVLLAILATASSRTLDDGAGWAEALEAGIEAVSHHGGAVEGDRTMLDALIPAQRVLAEGGTVQQVAEAAEEGARRTAQLQAKAGRAAHVPDAAARDTEDPGAVAVAMLFRAVSDSLGT